MNVNVETNSIQPEIIMSPHPHDVLCGRGGGINSHPGNQTFRNWVREKKEAYNLAANKIEKAKVSRDVLDQVASLSPPGRFLQKEEFPGEPGPVWVQIDDIKAMAKTSQALREGAPAIRAKAKCEPQRKKTKKTAVKNNIVKSESLKSAKNVLNEVIPRSKSLTRMIASGMSEEPPTKKLKSNSKHEIRSTIDVMDETKSKERNDDKKEETVHLNPNLPIFLSNVLSRNGKKETGKESIAVDTLTTVINGQCDKKPKQVSNDVNKSANNCSRLVTPTLLPVPAPTAPPVIDSFPLPPSTFSTIPLSPTLYEAQRVTQERFPPLLSPTHDPQMSRSNSLARCELSNEICTNAEQLLLLGTCDVDNSFCDPFTSENEHFERAVEGHPEFSATGLGTSRWNSSMHSGVSSSSRKLVRASSNVSTRSLSELSDLLTDLPDLENKLIETFEWNKGMNDVYVARDLDYNTDVTYLIPHTSISLKRRMSSIVSTNKRQKLVQ